MKIGELAARTGVSIRSLRYYEQQGLLMPVRNENGYREYSILAKGAYHPVIFESGIVHRADRRFPALRLEK